MAIGGPQLRPYPREEIHRPSMTGGQTQESKREELRVD
jgi:hypothetical protein